MNIAIVLRRVALVSVIATLFVGLVAPASHAAVDGQLGSSDQLQRYSGSLTGFAGEIDFPISTAVNSQGYIYLLGMSKKEDQYTDYLLKLNPDGSVVNKIPLSGVEMPFIFTDRNDNIYLSYQQPNPDGSHDGILHLSRYNSDLDLTLDVPIPTSAVGFETGSMSIYSATATPTGNILVGVRGHTPGGEGHYTNFEYLLELSPSGNLIKKSTIALENNHLFPLGLAYNSHGQLFASFVDIEGSGDSANMLLAQIDTSGKVLRLLDDGKKIPSGYGIGFDSDDNLYASSLIEFPDDTGPCVAVRSSLHKYNPDGTRIGTLDTSPEAAGGPVCSTYGISGTYPGSTTLTGAAGVTQKGDIFLASYEYSHEHDSVINPRIVKYSLSHNQANFSRNHKTAAADLRLPSGVNLVKATNNTLADIAAPADNGKAYPLGLVNFTAKVKDAQPVQVELLFETELQPSQVTPRKYHSGKKTYGDIPGAVVTQSTLEGKPALKLSYSIADGGEMDEDGVVNGTIVDPVGLAVAEGASDSATVGAPNTGHAQRSGSSMVVWSLLGGSAVLALAQLLRRPLLARKRIAASRRHVRR